MKKHLYFIIYKPFGVLSQFTDEGGNPGLGSVYQLPGDVYPVGRLDLDSEGLLILTNDHSLNASLLNPSKGHRRRYWVEVDGEPNASALARLQQGPIIRIKGREHQSLPVEVSLLGQGVSLPERNPPVNRLKHPATSWLELGLTEGKNRQVRRMTAAVGHPTLRLVRVAIEDLELFPMQPGDIRQISGNVIRKKLKIE